MRRIEAPDSKPGEDNIPEDENYPGNDNGWY